MNLTHALLARGGLPAFLLNQGLTRHDVAASVCPGRRRSLSRGCGRVRHRQAVSLSVTAARKVINVTGAVAQVYARVGLRRPLARADTGTRKNHRRGGCPDCAIGYHSLLPLPSQG